MPAAPAAEVLVAIEAALGRLEASLAQEQQALRSRDSAALDASVAAKGEALQSLERLGAELAQALGLAGRPPSSTAVQQGLEALGQGERWTAIRARLGRCRSANLDNGMLIEAGRSLNHNLLCILRGTPQAGTYGAGGRLDGGLAQQPIAEV